MEVLFGIIGAPVLLFIGFVAICVAICKGHDKRSSRKSAAALEEIVRRSRR